MTRGMMRITPVVLVHLRIALLGAASVVVEDLGTLISELESEIEQARHRGSPRKRAGYHELMAAVREHYELQATVGLPGEALREYTLPGRAQQDLVREVLSDYRAAARLAIESADEMSNAAQRDASRRIEEISTFLGDGRPCEEAAPVV